MSKYLLITTSVDYADEFNCEMFGLFTEEAWNKIVTKSKENWDKKFAGKTFSKYSGPEYEVGFGTNESLIISSFEEWRDSFTIKEITKEQFEKINDLFELSEVFNNNTEDEYEDARVWGTGSYWFTALADMYFDVDEDDVNSDIDEDEKDLG